MQDDILMHCLRNDKSKGLPALKHFPFKRPTATSGTRWLCNEQQKAVSDVTLSPGCFEVQVSQSTYQSYYETLWINDETDCDAVIVLSTHLDVMDLLVGWIVRAALMWREGKTEKHEH